MLMALAPTLILGGATSQVREEAFAILKMASKRLKAKVESGTIKGNALEETIKRAALIDAALKDTPPPPQPKVTSPPPRAKPPPPPPRPPLPTDSSSAAIVMGDRARSSEIGSVMGEAEAAAAAKLKAAFARRQSGKSDSSASRTLESGGAGAGGSGGGSSSSNISSSSSSSSARPASATDATTSVGADAKAVVFAHGWRGERAQRLALRHEEKARGESVVKEPVTGSEEPNMDLDRAGFEADKFVAHLLQTKTMKEVVNYRDTMHAENKQMISAIIGNATMLAEQLDARGHAEKLEKDNQEAALVYEQFVVVDMDGWMRATGQIRKKICSRFEELDAMVDELDRSIRGVSSETLRLESHLYRPIKVKLDEGNRTKQNLAKVQFVGSLPKTLQGCVQNGEFDLAAKYYALGLKLLDVVDRSAQKAAEKAREAAEQAKAAAQKAAAEKAAKLMIDGDAPIGLTAEELAMMIYLQENSSDSSASDPSAATFAATVKIRDECAMIMHTARLRLEMRLEERGLHAAARSEAKLSLGLIDCAIRGDAKGFDLGQDLGHLAKEVSWISREVLLSWIPQGTAPVAAPIQPVAPVAKAPADPGAKPATNPLADTPAKAPADPGAKAATNPFADTPAKTPADSGAKTATNPFADTPEPAADPFADAPGPTAHPFADAPKPAANPFADAPKPTANPFADGTPTAKAPTDPWATPAATLLANAPPPAPPKPAANPFANAPPPAPLKPAANPYVNAPPPAPPPADLTRNRPSSVDLAGALFASAPASAPATFEPPEVDTFLTGLPTRLQRCVQEGQYEAALEYFKMTLPLLNIDRSARHREIRMEANLVMHSARLRLESKLAEPDLTSRGIQETKAQLKKVEQMLHTALVTTLQRCVQEGRLELALEYYAQEVPPESPEAARNPFEEAGAETFESSMREEARSILSTARLRLIASLEEEELTEEDRSKVKRQLMLIDQAESGVLPGSGHGVDQPSPLQGRTAWQKDEEKESPTPSVQIATPTAEPRRLGLPPSLVQPLNSTLAATTSATLATANFIGSLVRRPSFGRSAKGSPASETARLPPPVPPAGSNPFG